MSDEIEKLAKAMVRAVFGGMPNEDVDELLQSSDAGSRFFVALTQAVHSFLGVEKGKELERDAVAKLVAALRGLLKAIDYQQKAARATDMKHAMAYEDLVRIEKDKAQVALRAAGEEVSDGG